MKRFHVHIHVDDLAQSIAFYSRLFAAEPARVEADYAKWMLDDPRVNFAISTRGDTPGLDHLGFQVDDAAELTQLKARAESADMALLDDSPRTAQARAMENCELAVFFRADFLGLMETDAVIGYKISLALARLIGQRLRDWMAGGPQVEAL